MTTPILKIAAVWLTSVLTSLAPAPMGGKADPNESPVARASRIESIAADIAEVVYDPSEEPIFMGPKARNQTAAMVATFAVEEGMNLSHGVDTGRILGDAGKSYCMMQINVGKGKTKEGWTGPDLIADRKKCIKAGMHALRRSFWTCKNNPLKERFAVYASGNCVVGRDISSRRWDRAMRQLYITPPPAELLKPTD